jgi:hypothetical protein
MEYNQRDAQEAGHRTTKIPEQLRLSSSSSLASLCSSQFSLILSQSSNSAADSCNFDTTGELFYRVANTEYLLHQELGPYGMAKTTRDYLATHTHLQQTWTIYLSRTTTAHSARCSYGHPHPQLRQPESR